MRIAIEAHALSQKKLTGVGKVVLHYMQELQRIDKNNRYFIYTQDDLKHLNNMPPNWEYLHFDYMLKRLRIGTRNKWLELKDKPGSRIANKALVALLRIMKISFEMIDDIAFTARLSRSLKKHMVDIYIGTSTYYFPYFFFSKIRKVGIIYDLVWKLYPETMELGNKLRMKFFTMRNMKKLDLLISISENTKKDAQEILRIDTVIRAIPLAADSSIFYEADKKSVARIAKKYGISKRYILSVCTLEPRKNLESLLMAFEKMKNRNRYQLVLVGMTGWIESDFFKGLQTADIREQIIFTGYVRDDDLAPLYTGAELFAFPSLYEGFGLPVLEAMQCGCPVVTSGSSSIPEVIGDAGIMVNPTDITGMAQAMEKVLSSADLRKKMKQKGIRRSKLFSWERSAREFLLSLEGLTVNKSG